MYHPDLDARRRRAIILRGCGGDPIAAGRWLLNASSTESGSRRDSFVEDAVYLFGEECCGKSKEAEKIQA